MSSLPDLSSKTAALLAMAEAHPGAFIDNLETAMFALSTEAGDIPVTRNDGARRTCYVCCPSVAYLDYAVAELRHFEGNLVLSAALHALIGVARPLLWASGVDRQVQLNNWLLATNPAVRLEAEALSVLTAELVDRHPRHALIWRSLNTLTDAELLPRFVAAGYALFPARQIYLFDCRSAEPTLHRDERRDRALLGQGDYVAVGPDQLAATDYARMAELYRHLYVDKYTRLNPQYSARFIEAAHRSGLISFHGLRGDDGRLDAVVGFFDLGDVMTAPIVGYDTTKPQALGLYRRLMAMGLERARARRLLFNMSAGAAGFKRNRGAEPAIEYAAIYARHLPAGQRLACSVVRTILEKVGPALLTRFEL